MRQKVFSILALLLMAATGAKAETVTWTASDMAETDLFIDFEKGDAANNTIKGITVTASGGGNGTWQLNYINMYEGSTTITFTSSVGNIKSIAITADIINTDGSTPSGWTLSDDKLSWSGDASPTVSMTLSDWWEIYSISDIVFTIESSTVNVTGITLDKTEASMIVGGETLTLTATVAPNDATDKTVTWTTSDVSVATVADGVVTAVGAGTATITATATNGTAATSDDFSATCEVSVADAATKYNLTLADGSDDHGTVAFTVGGAAATQAEKDDVVTVSVTPNDGYTVKGVTAKTSSQEVVSMSNGENGWTFTMPEDNVTVTVTYAKNLQDAWIQDIDDQTYTGSAITPTVTVKDGGTTLTLNDYTVAYSNNVETGTATVTVTGTGNYSGTATANFTIVADKSALNDDITAAETYYESIKNDHSEAAATLLEAINTAKGVKDNVNATQAEVEAAITALATAKTTAEQTVLTETKTALNNDITAAETYYNSIKESNPTAAATFLEAINAAKGVKDNADATQSEVDAAIAALAAAKTTAEQTVLTETKNELNDAIDEAEGYYNSIKESNPTAAATFLEAINNAKAVKDNADATQEQIAAAIAALAAAKTATQETVLTETKTALNDAITEAETYYNSIKDDHADAANDLKDAIDAAKAVKDNTNATQSEVDAAIAALAAAKTTAEQTVLTETKNELNDAIDEAEGYYNSIKESNPTAAATFLEAINNAKAVKDKADATQSEVDAAIATLAAAKTTAEQTVLTETKTALNDAITEAETYYNSIKDDHADAANDLKDAIDNAKTVKDNADATQSEVDAAIAALASAKTTAEQTVLTETKTALNDAIDEAEAYYNSIKDDHAEAAATLLEAINAAKAVKEKSDATQAEVDAAIAALTGAADAAYEAQGLKRITLTEQYGTYCLDKDLDFSETTGLTAYIAAGYNKTEGSLLMVKVTSVPAGTGLLLKRDSEAGGTFTAKMITSSPYIYSNLLTGTTKETDVTTNDLILSKDDEGQIGFYRVKADGKIAANKAYLKGLAPATGAPRLTLEFLDDATDIAAITSKPADANRNSWYTLDGRKLQGAPAKKGIYLLNGKKVIVR